MTNLDFLRLAQSELEACANEQARQNGAMRERSIEEYRYNAGIVSGLLQASMEIEHVLRTAAEDQDE